MCNFNQLKYILSYIYLFQLMERHLVRVNIQVLKVKLKVRFPCKLTFELRDENKKHESTLRHQLLSGECNPKETLGIELQASYDSKKKSYEQHKVFLMVKMISNSGSIPAGNISFDVFGKQTTHTYDQELALEKCPDKAANILFRHSYEMIKVLDNEAISLQKANMRKQNYTLKHSLSGGLITTFNPGSNSYSSKNSQMKDVNSPIKNITPNNDAFSSLQRSIVNQKGGTEDHKKNKYGKDKSFYEQTEKNSMEKEVVKLRSEIKLMNSVQYKQNSQKLKEQNSVITNELQKTRQKLRGYERRERELNLQVKQAKEESQRLKNKITVLESGKNQMQIQSVSKERTIKQLTLQRKALQGKLQEINILLTNSTKKLEYREQITSEQLKKLSQKLSFSESEKQKLLVDQNNLLNKLQQSEKKNQTVLKEKERNFVEERSKYSKQIELLSSELNNLKEIMQERNMSIQDQTITIKTLNGSIEQLKQKLSSIEVQRENLSTTLKRELEIKKEHQAEITSYRATETEKTLLRKRNNELSSQISTLNQKIDRSNSEASLLSDKIKQLEQLLGERTKQRDSLNTKNNKLNRQLEIIRQQQAKVSRQAETLSVQNASFYQKYLEMKNLNDRLHKELSLLEQKSTEQFMALNKSKQIVENENEELKQSIDRLKNEIEVVKIKGREATNTILELNEAILISNEKLRREEDKYREMEELNNQLTTQIGEIERKQKLLNAQLKENGEQNFNLSRKLQNVESECYLFKDRIKQLEQTNSDIRFNTENIMKEKDKQINKQQEEISNLSLESQVLKEQLSMLKLTNNQMRTENGELKDSLKRQLQQSTIRDTKLREKVSQLIDLTQKLQSISKQNQELKLQNDRWLKSQEKMRREWSQYRESTELAFQNLLTQFSKQSLTNIQLLAFPDEKLSEMQSNLVKNLASIINRYQGLTKQNAEEISILSQQLKRSKQAALSLESLIDEKQKEHFQNMAKNIKLLKAQIQDLQSKISEKEDKLIEAKYQIEHLTKQSVGKTELIEEHKQEIAKLMEDVKERNNAVRQLEEQILALKSNEIKEKALFEGKIQEMKLQNGITIEGIENVLKEAQKKLKQYQKIIKQKDETIKSAQAEKIQSKYTIQKSERKIQEIEQKRVILQEERSQSQKKISESQKQLKTLTNTLNETKQAEQNERQKRIELQNRQKELYKKITQLQVQIQKRKAQVQSLKSLTEDLEYRTKQKEEKSKTLIEKQASQVTKYKQSLIKVTSLHELDEFKIQQLQAQTKNLHAEVNLLKEELLKRKQDSLKLSDQLNTLTNQQINNVQKIQNFLVEVANLNAENTRLKESKAALQQQLNLFQIQIEGYVETNKKVLTQKQQIESLQAELMKYKGMYAAQSSTSITQSRITRTNNTEDRRRIRELQILLERRQHEMVSEKKRILEQWQHERTTLMEQIARLKQRLQHTNEQFEFQREQFMVQIKSLEQDCLRLQNQQDEL